MAGESQQEPKSGEADPSVLTTEQMLREVKNASRLSKAHRQGNKRELIQELKSFRRELELREEHRKELKTDNATFTEAIRVSQETAVTAALAAAEKAREKESIVTQLANDKTALQFADLLKSQGAFSTAEIAGLKVTLNDVKESVSEIWAEQRGAVAVRQDQHVSQAAMVTIVGVAIAFITTVVIIVNVLTTR